MKYRTNSGKICHSIEGFETYDYFSNVRSIIFHHRNANMQFDYPVLYKSSSGSINIQGIGIYVIPRHFIDDDKSGKSVLVDPQVYVFGIPIKGNGERPLIGIKKISNEKVGDFKFSLQQEARKNGLTGVIDCISRDFEW